MPTIHKTSSGPEWRIKPSERKFLLLIGDFLLAVISIFLALYLWASADSSLTFNWQFITNQPPFWYYLLPFFWILLLSELYDVRRSTKKTETFQGVLMAAAISGIFYLVVFFLSPPRALPRLGVAYFILFASVLTLIWRLIYIRIFTQPLFMRRVVVVGAGRAGTELVKIIQGLWPPPFYLVGFADDDSEKIGTELMELPVLGGGADLKKMIADHNISDLIFSIS
ncbi:MAG: hypothetical protein HGA53_08035, partial [Anaerolineaceae bacterium]|nr:hypothetical protein [Anaerolineaceae bacterium]